MLTLRQSQCSKLYKLVITKYIFLKSPTLLHCMNFYYFILMKPKIYDLQFNSVTKVQQFQSYFL